MPTLAIAEASNSTFCPTYIPVAVIVGGTSGVGQGMAEAFARQTNGRAHIIILGQNAVAAEKIIAGFPKPTDADGWAHEFLRCDASSMASVRVVNNRGGSCGELECGETAEGLDNHLVMRYFARYLFTKELLPLLVRAQEQGQHAHMMTVLGAGSRHLPHAVVGEREQCQYDVLSQAAGAHRDKSSRNTFQKKEVKSKSRQGASRSLQALKSLAPGNAV
ncbi:hypothetical protein C8R43DRAFT_1141062 [Mycena crocata]|nr:hypothetical protein C8R43DRAFT_1141062 [Mycena crocata]